MKLNIVGEEVVPSLSLKNGTSRSILREPYRGPKWATSGPLKFLKLSHAYISKNPNVLGNIYAGFVYSAQWFVTQNWK